MELEQLILSQFFQDKRDDFYGENKKSHNYVQWDLAMELNESHYEVERSLNSILDFDMIGRVISQGDSNEATSYNYEDYDIAESGVYYYRIKQIDRNGDYIYSKTISIDVGDRAFKPGKARIYPNPSVGEFSIDIEIFENNQDINYLIYDNNGKLAVAQKTLANRVNEGEHVFTVDETQLVPGVYSIQLNIGSTTLKKKLIIIK